MRRNQLKIAPTVAVVLILSLLLTYFLMSGTMNSINDVSEQEALALLTENAVQTASGKKDGPRPPLSRNTGFLPKMKSRPGQPEFSGHPTDTLLPRISVNHAVSRAQMAFVI